MLLNPFCCNKLPFPFIFSWFCGNIANNNELSYYAKLDSQGDIVWEYISPYTFPRETPIRGMVNFVFRAYRYEADGPEIRGRLNGRLG